MYRYTIQFAWNGLLAPGPVRPWVLVGTYPPDDLAVIRVSGAGTLHPATFADSSKLQVGDIPGRTCR